MSHTSRSLSSPVLTVLEPDERARVDAAGTGLYRAIHRESVADVLDELKRQRVSAVLLSVVRCARAGDHRTATLVREFPSVPTAALLGNTPPSAEALLQLGNAGITTLIDVRLPSGWSSLRQFLASQAPREVDRVALDAIRRELGGGALDCGVFFAALFSASDRVGTIRELALRAGVLPSTLMSRFFRAGLPAPKRYLAFARLLRAARLFEDSGHSIAAVANTLEYSSPQSFGRHVRTLLGMTAGEFRTQYGSARMLERLLEELVRPYRSQLCALRPLVVRSGMRRIPPTLRGGVPAFHHRRD